VSSAITAYARIHMSQFKNKIRLIRLIRFPDFNLYYTDTDSVYINRLLPDNMINSKVLGKNETWKSYW